MFEADLCQNFLTIKEFDQLTKKYMFDQDLDADKQIISRVCVIDRLSALDAHEA